MKDRYEDYLKYKAARPVHTKAELMRALSISEVTYYRYRARDKERLQKIVVFEAEFDLPKAISHRILPPAEYIYTHIAAYLARFNPDELVPPYNKTPGEVMYSIRQSLNASPVRASDLVFGLQERLALFALYNGEVRGFKDSKGKLVIPERY